METICGLSVRSVRTDTSPGNSNPDGSGSRPQSNQPTPSSSSNQNSSHTSYTSPPNQTGGGNHTTTTQAEQSPGFMFTTHQSWNMIASNQIGPGAADQAQNLNFGGTGMTPGRTGMTPMADATWPTEGMSDGGEWMFNWPGSTPQPQ
jgi:hypothetical protein